MTIALGSAILPSDIQALVAQALLSATDGTLGLPGFAFKGDQTAGFYRRADGGIGLVRNGVEALTCSAAGIVDGRVVGPDGDVVMLSLIAGGILTTPQMYGVKGDGTTDDAVALQAAIASGNNLWFPPATYATSQMLTVVKLGQLLSGPGQLANIKFLPGALIQPIMLVTQAATNSRITGLGFDHQGSLFPTPSTFLPSLFNGNAGAAGDARGVAILVMADGAQVDHVYVDNSWDDGIAFGNFDLGTGAESAGPDHVKALNCSTYNCGSGKHSWSAAPNGYYFQGAGIDMLTATNYAVVNCIDYASYNAFWSDTEGGSRGLWTGCVSINCQQGPVWADSAQGGNQPWYMSGFGTTITFPGSGYLKTPGGTAFYSGSYDVQFSNCVAINPAWIGLALDPNSSGNLVSNFRVVGAGGPGIVNNGLKNSLNGIALRGCGTAAGKTAASGSVCPAIGALESVGQAGQAVKTKVTDLVIDGSPAYPGQSSTLTYPYAIYARADRASGATSEITVIGADLTPGVDAVAGGNDGIAFWDAGCSVTIVSVAAGQLGLSAYGSTAALSMASNGTQALQISQDAGGDVTITGTASGKTLTLNQAGSGDVVLSIGGTQKLTVSAAGVVIPLSTTVPTAGSGILYKNGSGAVLAA